MKFKDKSWEKHKTISFDTLTDRQTYEVLAVFKTVVYTDSSDSFKYYHFVNVETRMISLLMSISVRTYLFMTRCYRRIRRQALNPFNL